jgi:hypothetical protein
VYSKEQAVTSDVSPGLIAKLIADSAEELNLEMWKIRKRGKERHI